MHPWGLWIWLALTLTLLLSLYNKLGAVSIRKTVLLGMAIPMLKIRRPTGRLIFNMGIPIPGKDGLYIETGPWLCWNCVPSLFVELCHDMYDNHFNLFSLYLIRIRINHIYYRAFAIKIKSKRHICSFWCVGATQFIIELHEIYSVTWSLLTITKQVAGCIPNQWWQSLLI